MQNPRLAGRYAKSLIDIATEQGELANVYADAVQLKRIIAISPEFAALLKSPVIKADKKLNALNAVLQGRIGKLMQLFLVLLVKKGREAFLSEIIKAFVDDYDRLKGIHHINVRTAVPMSEAMQQYLINKIEQDTGMHNIEIHPTVEEDLIGGFVIEFENKLVDASVRKYLKDVKSQFRENTYIRNIR